MSGVIKNMSTNTGKRIPDAVRHHDKQKNKWFTVRGARPAIYNFMI